MLPFGASGGVQPEPTLDGDVVGSWSVDRTAGSNVTPYVGLEIPLEGLFTAEVFGSRRIGAHRETWHRDDAAPGSRYAGGVHFERTGLTFGLLVMYQSRHVRFGGGATAEGTFVRYTIGECRCDAEERLKAAVGGPTLAAAVRLPRVPFVNELRVHVHRYAAEPIGPTSRVVPSYDPSGLVLFIGLGTRIRIAEP